VAIGHAERVTRRAWIALFALASLWGASYLFIKVALDDGVAPATIVFLRVALAAALLIPFALHRGVLAPLRGRIAPVVVLALVQVVGPFLLITVGERDISSSLAGILVASAPIFTALLAIRLDQSERMRGLNLVGVGIGIVGVTLLLGLDTGGGGAALLGGLMVLLAGFGYAVGGFYLKKRLGDLPPLGVVTGTMSASALVLLPAIVVAPPTSPSTEAVGSLLALGLGGTGVAFIIFYTLITTVGPSRASIVAYVAPGFAVIYGVSLLDESFTLGTLAGLVLILAGSWLAGDGRLPGRSREADLPVGPGPGLGPLDEVEPLERGAEQPRDEPEPSVLRA
jgi:drug/metabolite transporter (DMT)-like permease